MNYDFRRLAIVLACMGFLGLGGSALAQDPDEQPIADDPAIGLPPPVDDDAPPQADPITTVRDPLIKALLETNPSTPESMVKAINILIDRKHAAVAKVFVGRLLAADLSPEQQAHLVSEFGTATFLRIGRLTELAPEGQQLAAAVLDGATAWSTDEARIAQLVAQLQDPEVAVRRAATRQLRPAGLAAVGPLVAVLADPNRADGHAPVRAALVSLGPQVAEPLLAVLYAGDAPAKAQAIDVLARLDAAGEASAALLAPYWADDSEPKIRQAAEVGLLRFLGRIPSKQESARFLASKARAHYNTTRTLSAAAEEERVLWEFDPATGELSSRRYSAVDASIILAARMARDAHRLAPADLGIRRLFLAALLEATMLAAGADRPLPLGPGTAAEVAMGHGVAAIEDVLAVSLGDGHTLAAAAAASLLGEMGDVAALTSAAPEPSPLVKALRHGDRRVRFAALESVIKLNPGGPFPGASFVPEALGDFVSSLGAPKVLVAHHKLDEAGRLAGLFMEMGYAAEATTDPRQFVREALRTADYELAIVDVDLVGISVDELIQQLRRDSRTASLPVAIVAGTEAIDRAAHVARHDSLSVAIVRPFDIDGAGAQIDPLLDRVRRNLVTPEERRTHAARSLEILKSLAESPQQVYDLSRTAQAVETALYDPALASQAVEVVASFASPRAQQALVDLASRATQPLELRQAARAGFETSVERHGLLLTSKSLLAQYDRYNQSESQDAATQGVLSAILDVLESRVAERQPDAPPAAVEP